MRALGNPIDGRSKAVHVTFWIYKELVNVDLGTSICFARQYLSKFCEVIPDHSAYQARRCCTSLLHLRR